MLSDAQCELGDLVPAVVDGEGAAAVRDVDDLGDASLYLARCLWVAWVMAVGAVL